MSLTSLGSVRCPCDFINMIRTVRLTERKATVISISCVTILFILNFFGGTPPDIQKPCKVHDLDPWDKVLLKYVTYSPPPQCSTKSSLVYVDEKGYMQYNSSALDEYSLSSIQCVYMEVKREDDDFKVTFKKAVPFEPPYFIPCRIFRVVCKNGAKVVYDFVHYNIVWNESQEKESEIGLETDEQLSVIYLGFDSLSRSEFERKGNLSYDYLMNNLNAYKFKGMMKVGFNTYPNLVVLLRGDQGEHMLYSHLLRIGTKFDNEKFLWADAKKQDYATMWVEDTVDGGVFRGMIAASPVDYYYRPVLIAMNQSQPVILDKLGKSSRQCYGNKNQFLLQLDYLKRFLVKYKGQRKFAFLWSNGITHDAPVFEQIDKHVKDFIEWMNVNGHLKRSILVFGSDHGFRLGGEFTKTYIGKLEMNMPALLIHFPKHLLAKHPHMHSNLQENTKRLVTHYDVYETMKGVINADFFEGTNASPKKGHKLYSPVPTTRSCADAGIHQNFCTCQEELSPVGTKSALVLRLANHAVDKINEILINFCKGLCQQVSLLAVTEAKVSYKPAGNDVIHEFREFYEWLYRPLPDYVSGRYDVEFYTQPNNGLFRASLDYDKGSKVNEITLMDDPVRMDKYGNQSHCIDNSFLKQFCLCNDVHIPGTS